MLVLLALFSAPALAAEEGALAAIPFGVAHFMWGKPVRGLVYAGTQAAGIAAATVGTVKATESLEAGDNDGIQQWQIVAGAGVGLASLSYLVQAIDGSRLAEQRQAEQARLRLQWFDAGRNAAEAPLGPVPPVGEYFFFPTPIVPLPPFAMENAGSTTSLR